MSNENTSGLAAVHAAAGAISKADHDAAMEKARAILVAQHEQALADATAKARAEGVTAGATAERTRILGIEKIAMPGHDKLIGECKADPNCTPEAAAMRVVEAEKTLRGAQLQNIQAVEAVAGGLKSPALPTGGEQGGKQQSNAAATPESWKAEYEQSAALKGEFASSDDYVAFKKAEAAGNVRIFSRRA